MALIQKHAPEIWGKLRKLFCDKLGWACFTAGTPVHTQVGQIPIEMIREGDLAYSRNPETGEWGLKRVESVSRREVSITYEIWFGEQSVTTTAEHPFWGYGKGFVDAEELEAGDEIVCDWNSVEEFCIESITEIVKRLHPDKVPVYNFSVEDWHTYFVGTLGLWVHNAKCKPKNPNGYRMGDIGQHKHLSPDINRVPGSTYKVDNVQAHHIIPDEWARKIISNYKRGNAPAILLETGTGKQHTLITNSQATRRKALGWNNDIKSEFNLSYKEMINAGVDQKTAKKAIKQSYKYFDGLGVF